MQARMDFSRFPRKVLPSHETLFFEEEQSRELYVLLSGSLGVYRDEVQVATIDEPLSVVGEISALTGQLRNATVRTLAPSQLLVVEDPDRLFEEYPQLGARLARVLAGRLKQMNDRFVELKGVIARGAGVPEAAGEGDGDESVEEERTLQLKLDRTMYAGELAAAATAALAQPAGGARPSEVPDDLLNALSDLLEWDPDLGIGT